MLIKVMGGVVGLVAHEILASAQGPLFLGFGAKGLGPGLDKKSMHKLSFLPFEVISHVQSSAGLPDCAVANLELLTSHLLESFNQIRVGCIELGVAIGETLKVLFEDEVCCHHLEVFA